MRNLAYIILASIILTSCTKEELPLQNQQIGNELESGWLVPLNDLILSQLPPDRIHSIDAPHFVPIRSSNLKPNDVASVYRYGNTVKVYPQSILGGHEIVNDQIDGHYFAVSFCPLTGSAIAWNRKINGKITEFGVSGHLFNENLIPYDRNDTSFWSQMHLEGIKGRNAGQQLDHEFLLTALGSTIKTALPDAMVLVDSSGHNCDSICAVFKQGGEFGEPGDNDLDLPNGDLFGIVSRERVLLMNYNSFDDNIKLYQNSFGSMKLILVGSKALQFITAFRNNTGDPSIQFFPIQHALPAILKDSNGNHYDMTGLVVSGPSKGMRLPAPISYWAHSFAWNSLFNNIELLEDQ